MKYVFHPEAEQELDFAVGYYEEQKAGLGIEFADEVFGAVVRICEYPDAWAAMSLRTRRCLVHRFPYSVIYQSSADLIIIVAVASLHRRPGYWMSRQGSL